MFCGNCGTENPEGTPFCAGCGAALGGTKSKGGNFKVNPKVIIAAVVGVLAVVILVTLLFGGNSPTKVVDKFMAAVVDADAKGMMKQVSDDVIDYMMEEEDMDKDDWNDQLDDLSDNMKDMYEQMEDYYDGKVKITYDVKSEKDLDEDELEDLQDYYEDKYDIKVKDAKTVKVKVTTKCGDYKDSNTMELVVVKIGGKWSIDIDSADMF